MRITVAILVPFIGLWSVFANASAGHRIAGDIIVPADISVRLIAKPDSNIALGEPIDFTLSVTNHGPELVNELTLISSDFVNEFNLDQGEACPNEFFTVTDGEAYHYNIGWAVTGSPPEILPLEVGETRICHIQLFLTESAPTAFPFGFHLLARYEDIDPTNDSATVVLRRVVDAATPIPGLSWTTRLALLGLLTACAGAALPGSMLRVEQARRGCSCGLAPRRDRRPA
jgi:hypothetical protein